MSFLGGNTSRDAKSRPEAAETRSQAIFLGEASKLGKAPAVAPAEEQAAPTFGVESRVFGQQGPTPPEKCTNVVAAGAKWKGSLTVDDSVRIEGTFSGEVQTKATVHIVEGAQVDAKIRAAFVVVAGSFQGEIRCEQRVDLLPRSRVSGEIYTKAFTVQEGAKLDGRVQMTGGLEAEPARPARGARSEELAAAAPPRRNGED